jgi:lipopolysaccharide/colanic/teichoic acid biosynthesis glycosyltransferase
VSASTLVLKRAFDVAAAIVGLLCLSPLFLAVAVVIKLDSEGPVFFTQERIGRGFRPFRIIKFRTMVKGAPQRGAPITFGQDPRITRVGRFLRHTKLDELPQLLNVVRGDMSLVGPRPELRQYVEQFRRDYEEILTVRPGLTDPASLRFRDEAGLLAAFKNPEETYLTWVLPEKIELGKQYARTSSLIADLALIFRTLAALTTTRI